MKNHRTNSLTENSPYSIIFKDKKHLLMINNGEQLMEIITINHFALVLLDTVSNEKYFLAPADEWERKVKEANQIVL